MGNARGLQNGMADEYVNWESGRPEDLWLEGFDAWVAKLELGLWTLLTRFEPEIEAWMKTNATWTDRTGQARQTLHTEVELLIGEAALHLMHGKEYGMWLELKNQGAFAIVLPALDYWAPKIWDAVLELFQ